MNLPSREWAAYLRFRDQFAEAIDPRLYTLDWLDHQVLTGFYRLWVSDDAAIIVGLKHYPTGAVDVEGIIAAGDKQEIITALIPQAEEWGRANGCVGAIIESREGWERALEPHGYRRHQIAIRKVF